MQETQEYCPSFGQIVKRIYTIRDVNALDSLDRQLIALLREDGRASVSHLAQRLQISRGTVQGRIDRLIESGVILGFTARVSKDVDDGSIRALMMIELAGKSTKAAIRPLRGIPEIRVLHTTNGTWGVIAEIRTASLADLDRVLNDVRMIEGVRDTNTSILLTTTS
jgi:DNA-binding Lrp family transcriptional regulator